MVKHVFSRVFLSLLLVTLAMPMALAERQTSGDILLIEKVIERMSRDLPANGLSKAEVERRFGEPLQRSATVGDPPITRWTYDGYSVYFEYDLVIDSVLHPEAVIREINAGRR